MNGKGLKLSLALKERENIFVLAYMVLMFFVPGISTLAAIHIILVTFIKKNEWFFKGLVYFILLKSLNPALHPPNNLLFLAYVMLITIYFLFHMLHEKKIYLFKLESKLYIVLLLFFITSFLGSLYPDLSLIRIFILSLIMFAIFQSLKVVGKYDTHAFMIKIAIFIIYFSLPLLASPKGYLMPMGFFKGILNHSQELAMVLLPFYLIYLMTIIHGKIRNNVFHTITLILGITELILSASRSGVFALVGAVLLYYFLNRPKGIHLKTIVKYLSILLVTIVFVSFNQEMVTNKIKSFVLKYDKKAQISGENVFKSRAKLVDTAIKNFKEHPWTGVGFNVQTKFPDPFYNTHWREFAKYIPGTNIMYSRPLEKGNLYASVFEEGGVIVGLYFIYILLWLFKELYSSKQPYLWVPYFAILMNMSGEASFFSVMGLGNIQILLFAWFYYMTLKTYSEKRNV